jgi:hypothetical protein
LSEIDLIEMNCLFLILLCFGSLVGTNAWGSAFKKFGKNAIAVAGAMQIAYGGPAGMIPIAKADAIPVVGAR